MRTHDSGLPVPFAERALALLCPEIGAALAGNRRSGMPLIRRNGPWISQLKSEVAVRVAPATIFQAEPEMLWALRQDCQPSQGRILNQRKPK